MSENKSQFLTNEEGKPLCQRCNIRPICGECRYSAGHSIFLCWSCMEKDYQEFDVVEEDETLVVCSSELDEQFKESLYESKKNKWFSGYKKK